MFEDFKEIDLEALKESKFYMRCKKDNPRFVPPPIKTKDDAENFIKKQAETEDNQVIETDLSHRRYLQ